MEELVKDSAGRKGRLLIEELKKHRLPQSVVDDFIIRLEDYYRTVCEEQKEKAIERIKNIII